MLTNPAISDPDFHPIPPRFRWLKRITLASIAFLLLLAALRLWIGYHADVVYDRAIAQIRANGEPILVEDFNYPHTPDEQNGSVQLLKAHAAMVTRPAGGIAIDVPDLWSVRDSIENYRVTCAANSAALDQARQGLSKQQFDWGTRLKSPMVWVLLPHLSPQRTLAKLILISAMTAHVNGDDARCVDDLTCILKLSPTTHGRLPTLISHLVTIAIDSIATQGIEQLTPSIQIADADAPSAKIATQPTSTVDPSLISARSPATRPAVENLIRLLLDDRPLAQSHVLAWHVERAMLLDACITNPAAAMAAGIVPSWPDRLLDPLFRPLWKLGIVRRSNGAAWSLAATRARNWPDAARLLPANEQPRFIPWDIVSWRSGLLSANSNRAYQLFFRALAQRRMAAVALAIRLYEIDHANRPNDLAALVPTYLPFIPIDPFSADDRPIQLLHDAQYPRLFCIGFDGIDDHGRFDFSDSGFLAPEKADFVFFLNGMRPFRGPPQPPPTTIPSF